MKLPASIIVAIALAMRTAGMAAAQSDDLNPDAKQVAVVRQEHLAELMKIPHVVGVATELSDDGDVVLDLEVDKAENVTDVEREAPSEVDGFPVDVDVVEHAETGPNFSSFGSINESP
jgi:hypothetical protein